MIRIRTLNLNWMRRKFRVKVKSVVQVLVNKVAVDFPFRENSDQRISISSNVKEMVFLLI